MGDWVVKLETTSARWELKYRNVRQDSQDAAPNANLPGKQAVSGFNLAVRKFISELVVRNTI